MATNIEEFYDLVTLYVSDAETWANFIEGYFKECLGKDGLKIFYQQIRNLKSDTNLKSVLPESKAQLVIVSPELLDFLDENRNISFKQIICDINVGILIYLGTKQDDFKPYKDRFPDFKASNTFIVSEDPTILKTMMAEVVSIIETANSDSGDDYVNIPSDMSPSRPRGVSHSSSSSETVTNLAGESDDTYLVMGDKPSEEPETDNVYLDMEITKTVKASPAEIPKKAETPPGKVIKPAPRKPPNKPPKEQSTSGIEIYPKTVQHSHRDNVIVTFKTEVTSSDKVEFILQHKGNVGPQTKVSKAARINPYTFCISIPEIPDGSYTLFVHDKLTNQEVGSVNFHYKSQLQELSHLLKYAVNPLQMLADALGVNAENVDEVDIALNERFKQDMPHEGLHVFRALEGIKEERSKKKLPTLIHFSARYGLKELCATLMSCPGANQAYSVENCDGDYPEQLAEKHNHLELAKFLKVYLESREIVHGIYVEMYGSNYYENKSTSSEPYYNQQSLTAGYDKPFKVPIPVGIDEVQYGDAPKLCPQTETFGPGYLDMRANNPPDLAEKTRSSSDSSDNTAELPLYDVPISGNPESEESFHYDVPSKLCQRVPAPIARGSSKSFIDTSSQELYLYVEHSDKKSSTLPRQVPNTNDPFSDAGKPSEGSPSVVPASRSLNELSGIMEEYKRGSISMDECISLGQEWLLRNHGADGNSKEPSSFKKRMEDLEKVRQAQASRSNLLPGTPKSKKSFFHRFWKGKKKTSTSEDIQESIQQDNEPSELPPITAMSGNSARASIASNCSTTSSSSSGSESTHRDSFPDRRTSNPRDSGITADEETVNMSTIPEDDPPLVKPRKGGRAPRPLSRADKIRISDVPASPPPEIPSRPPKRRPLPEPPSGDGDENTTPNIRRKQSCPSKPVVTDRPVVNRSSSEGDSVDSPPRVNVQKPKPPKKHNYDLVHLELKGKLNLKFQEEGSNDDELPMPVEAAPPPPVAAKPPPPVPPRR